MATANLPYRIFANEFVPEGYVLSCRKGSVTIPRRCRAAGALAACKRVWDGAEPTHMTGLDGKKRRIEILPDLKIGAVKRKPAEPAKPAPAAKAAEPAKPAVTPSASSLHDEDDTPF